MSSDEEDLDLNEDTASQLETATDDGAEAMELEDPQASPAASPQPQLENVPDTRKIDLQLNPQLLTCKSYDCIPLVAAVHPSAIYSLAATRCYRWVLTGSEDGYIRKWDFFASMNGKTSLTQVQRHHNVDSVTLAGVLSSWWENEEQPEEQAVKNEEGSTPAPPPTLLGEPKLSPVFSIDIHSEALWAVQGCENGSINLVSVRHEEGKCHHVFRKHQGPVSVLMITPDETGLISGSWDKSVLEWDLNTGAIVRSYDGHSSQISSAHFRPMFTPTIPKTSSEPVDTSDLIWDTKDPNILMTTSIDGQCLLWDRREPEKSARRLKLPDRTPPWCLSACWSADGSKIYMGRRNGTVDEYDYAQQKWVQSFRMPANSGPVSYVTSMPNGNHIICASNDNIRLWNTTTESSFTIKPETEPGFVKPTKNSSVIPFSILPGHHGGTISHISIDPTCRYMITTSGTRGWDGVSTNSCLFYDIAALL